MRKLKALVARAAPNVLGVAGLAVIAVGFGLAWLPLGFMTGGAALFLLGYLLSAGPDADDGS